MTNLLPEEAKKIIYKEYLFRLGALSLLLFIVSVVVGGFFLLPALLLAEIKEREAEKQSATVELVAALNKDAPDIALVASINKKIAVFSQSEEERRVPDIFRAIVQARPDGVSIRSISFEKNLKNKVFLRTVIINGEASKRDTLILFSDTLKENKIFSNVTVPTAQLVKNTDAPFTITALVANN